MEHSMGPPLLPGFSLRAMLFRANAHSVVDKPIRCFRVVTSPDATVRDFCQEASRIHEINYGEPITIKKVQDDQEFDITQGELLGSLFKNLDTIRVIQAVTHPGVRDSLPPTSALRFDPSTSRKRGREESVRPNGSPHSDSFKSNKRQRISDVDPDHPLPSREVETNGRRPSVIPDSQDSVIPGASNGVYTKPRHVRHSLPRRIPRTPSPPPLSKTTSENGFADHRDGQSDNQSLNGDSNNLAGTERSTPLRDAPQRALSHTSNPPRAKSASYHIPRANERGASVSTAATSPLSIDQQVPLHNSVEAAMERKRAEPIFSSHNGPKRRSPKEQTIYDNVNSDGEGPAVSKTKKAILKSKSSPGTGLPGLDWANKKVNTPPSTTQRSSGSREPVTTPGELPLTPMSKKREEKRLQSIENARKAGMAAVEAAERRKREADEARQVEEARVATIERAKREEQERIEVEEFKRGEAERRATAANTARLNKEREAREKKDAEQRKRADLERIAKQEVAEAEAKRLRSVEEEREKKVAEAEGLKKLQEEASKTRLPSSSPAEARAPVSSSPILPRGTPGSRAHSGTPFIPPRKSALKNVVSSQAMRTSSPAGPSRSPEASSNGVGIETQMPLPKTNRRVSFKQEVEQNESPVPPSSRILPPARSYTSTPPAITPKKPAVKPTVKTQIVDTKLQPSSTPILPPKRPGLERSITPAIPSKAIAPANAIPAKVTAVPQSHSPDIEVKKIPPPSLQSRRSETPVRPPSKEKPKLTSAEPPDLQPSALVEPSSEDSDSNEEVVQKASAGPSPNASSPTRKLMQAGDEPQDSDVLDDEDEDMVDREELDEEETQSQNSSTRDSRSPVSFIQHPKAVDSSKPSRAASLPSDTSSEDEEMQDAIDETNSIIKDNTQASVIKGAKYDDSDSSNSDSESDEDTTIQVPKSSPPRLPAHRSTTKPMETKLSQVNTSKDSSRNGPFSTQDQVDHQLTSSMYEVRSSLPAASTPTPIPASSTIARPPSIKFGASLSSLHQNKFALGASSQLKSLAARNGQGQRKMSLADNYDDSDSSESESEDSSSDDDDDDAAKAPTVKQPVRPASWDSSKKMETSQTENSDSEGSEDEEEAEKRKAGNELAAQVAAMASSQGSVTVPSPRVYNLSTQPSGTPKAKVKKVEKKRDKYTSGYVFSQVR